MFKNILISLVALLFGLTALTAAPEAGLTGKVTSIEGNIATIEVGGDIPDWMKKGAYLRATLPDGKLLLRGAKITVVEGKVITLNTPKAKEMTVGDTYTLAKGKASPGC